MFGLGIGELLLVGLLGVLFFGSKKLPELGSAMGKAIVNFKKGLNHDDSSSNLPSTQDENGTLEASKEKKTDNK